jgi:hypothetical protein
MISQEQRENFNKPTIEGRPSSASVSAPSVGPRRSERASSSQEPVKGRDVPLNIDRAARGPQRIDDGRVYNRGANLCAKLAGSAGCYDEDHRH